MARIALVNAPFHSHVAAMARLGDVLSRQGHELIVWAPEEWRGQVERLGARFEPSSPSVPRLSGDGLAAAWASATEREADRLIRELHGYDVDLLIRDSQTPWALVAARYLGLPRLVAHPMFPGAAPESSDGAEPDPVERLRFEQSWLSIARRWGVELGDVRGLYHRASEPTLIFTTEEIVGDHELPGSWRCVGPLLSPPPARDPAPGRPLVYACFGTARNRKTELFRLVIAAVDGRPVDLLISAGGRTLTADDLGTLPSNVTIDQYAPSRDVLARASVLITHAGCNSVHEALVAGVPMVCLPQAFDQIPLSRRVAELGVGVVAAEEPGDVALAVLSLLGDNQVRARAEGLSVRLQGYDGETRVAAAVADALSAAPASAPGDG